MGTVLFFQKEKVRKNRTAPIFLLAYAGILFLSCASPAFSAEYKNVPGIIGVNSSISAGDAPVSVLVKMARERGTKVVVLTDQALARGEYGLWPLRRIIRKVIEKKSILFSGPQGYLDQVREINRAARDMVVIPAADVAPFYYWTGLPFRKDFTVHNWSKQILVIGLKEASDFKDLPLVANKYRSLRYDHSSIPRLWPLIPLILGILLFRRWRLLRPFGARNDGKKWSLSLFVIILSTLFLANNFPFTAPPEFDQYHGDRGMAPYQRLIDYVNRKGGMAFWSTPEAKMATDKGDGVNFCTIKEARELLKIHDYIGFGVIYGDVRTAHKPGREWDQLLREHCQGKRKRPIWGIGEADFHGGPLSAERIDAIQTVFLLQELTERSVLDALKNGKMYARRNHRDVGIDLEEFTVYDPRTGKVAYMGDELAIADKVNIVIKGSYRGAGPVNFKIQVIRNGEEIKVYDTAESRFSFELTDEPPKTLKKSYYRLIITSPTGEIVSNPIFVKS